MRWRSDVHSGRFCFCREELRLVLQKKFLLLLCFVRRYIRPTTLQLSQWRARQTRMRTNAPPKRTQLPLRNRTPSLGNYWPSCPYLSLFKASTFTRLSSPWTFLITSVSTMKQRYWNRRCVVWNYPFTPALVYTSGQRRAEGDQTGRQPRASKAGGIQRVKLQKLTFIKMLWVPQAHRHGGHSRPVGPKLFLLPNFVVPRNLFQTHAKNKSLSTKMYFPPKPYYGPAAQWTKPRPLELTCS